VYLAAGRSWVEKGGGERESQNKTEKNFVTSGKKKRTGPCSVCLERRGTAKRHVGEEEVSRLLEFIRFVVPGKKEGGGREAVTGMRGSRQGWSKGHGQEKERGAFQKNEDQYSDQGTVMQTEHSCGGKIGRGKLDSEGERGKKRGWSPCSKKSFDSIKERQVAVWRTLTAKEMP